MVCIQNLGFETTLHISGQISSNNAILAFHGGKKKKLTENKQAKYNLSTKHRTAPQSSESNYGAFISTHTNQFIFGN